ncbi:MAG: 50S ribosomal protein L33 [Pseudomonadota bacterium]
MAKKGPRGTVKLECLSNKEGGGKSGHVYYTSKNSRNTTEKLKLRKYDPETRKHVEFVEGKMK